MIAKIRFGIRSVSYETPQKHNSYILYLGTFSYWLLIISIYDYLD